MKQLRIRLKPSQAFFESVGLLFSAHTQTRADVSSGCMCVCVCAHTHTQDSSYAPYGQSCSIKLLKVLTNKVQRYAGELFRNSRVLHLVQEVTDLHEALRINFPNHEMGSSESVHTIY
jgi:hypothetical protein